MICGSVRPVRLGGLGFTGVTNAVAEMVAYIAGFTVSARKPWLPPPSLVWMLAAF